MSSAIPEYRSPDDPIGDVGSVGEFWRWAMSDLLNNRNRGILAEFLVAKALGEGTLTHPRLEWDCYDVVYRSCRIEVKSSAYIQTWHSAPEQRSQLSFSVGASRCWDARTNTYSDDHKRHADLYVFCVFPADPGVYSRDVLDLDQWAFYLTTTANLEDYVSPGQRQVGLALIRKACGDPVRHHQLKATIDHLLDPSR